MAGAAYHKRGRRQQRRARRNTAVSALLCVIVLVVSYTAETGAQGRGGDPSALKLIGWGTGETARDGDTFILRKPVAGGRQVRLVGIEAPASRRTGPRLTAAHRLLAQSARDILDHLVRGKELRLSSGGRAKDRYRRHLAHVHLKDGRWVQAELLRQGLARVNSFADNRALLRPMLAMEQEARQAKRGIWAIEYFRVRTPEEVGDDLGSFQIVRGTVVDAARVRKRIYLNFGNDWRTDFTAQIEPGGVRAFAKSDPDPLGLKGRDIRVRGWVEHYNGPMIHITHPEQIEIVK